MKVVALVSGGKDSTMNMLECIARGHEVVALANLHPPPGAEELDSFMYQSVGHDAIQCFAECCELALYRRQITGLPTNQCYDYQPTAGDEVEDLYELLSEIKTRHPDVEGVSSGAIHSAYQKNRVENVCARLGMVSLAFLWNRDQEELLADMIRAGIEAVVVKTAVMGLDERDLGKSIGELHPRLLQLKEQYAINVCGEGGEFESLTLDCPLFRRNRMQLTGYDVVKHKDCAFAPVNYLKITGIVLVPK